MAVFSNNGVPNATQRVYVIRPAEVATGPYSGQYGSANELAKNLIARLLSSPAGERIVWHFVKQKPGWWRKILQNRSMSVEDKWLKIFGVPLTDVFPQARLLGMIGNFFEDIGNWFSGGGAERLALEIEKQSGEIARVLNALRNKPNYDPSKEQSALDFQSQTFWKAQDFLSQWGWLIIAGLGLVLILRK